MISGLQACTLYTILIKELHPPAVINNYLPFLHTCLHGRHDSSMHRCIAILVTRYVSRYSLQQSRYPRSCNILAFLFECHTDINCQSAKNYQCRMSSHPQQTAGSSRQLKSIKSCCMSLSRHLATNGVMTCQLSLGPVV